MFICSNMNSANANMPEATRGIIIVHSVAQKAGLAQNMQIRRKEPTCFSVFRLEFQSTNRGKTGVGGSGERVQGARPINSTRRTTKSDIHHHSEAGQHVNRLRRQCKASAWDNSEINERDESFLDFIIETNTSVCNSGPNHHQLQLLQLGDF